MPKEPMKQTRSLTRFSGQGPGAGTGGALAGDTADHIVEEAGFAACRS
jgi:hypothetical protein